MYPLTPTQGTGKFGFLNRVLGQSDGVSVGGLGTKSPPPEAEKFLQQMNENLGTVTSNKLLNFQCDIKTF